MSNNSFKVDDVVIPGMQFPFYNSGLHRNCRGTVIKVNGNKITVQWSESEIDTYNNWQLEFAPKI